MPFIPLPKPATFEGSSTTTAKLVIEPLYPGYGTTVGNLLRRVLLSSLSGAAVCAVKITGVDHEFSSIENVKEDFIEVIQNVKKIRIKAKQPIEEPVTMQLRAAGEGEVKVSAIEAPSELELVNKNELIATLTGSAAKLEIDFLVTTGIGYVPAEAQEREDKDVGFIDVDSIFTPVVKVGMAISNVRVGKMTNYEKLEIDIATDGTRSPQEAFDETLDIILEQLNFLKAGESEAEVVETEETAGSQAEATDEASESQAEEE